MRSERGLTLIEILIIIVCVLTLVLIGVVVQSLDRPSDEARKVRCMNNLTQIATAMNLYLNRNGGTSMYAIPAQSFRGDSWLAVLYWTEIIREPKEFICPNTDDRGHLPVLQPHDIASADSIPSDAISYAGLCRGLRGPYAHRNTRVFTEAAISSASLLACDDNEGRQNHPDGMCLVYFDCHAEFNAGTRADTYDLIGAKGGPYEYLDSGE